MIVETDIHDYEYYHDNGFVKYVTKIEHGFLVLGCILFQVIFVGKLAHISYRFM